MKDVIVTVQGDPDTASFTRIFRFCNKSDYIILTKVIRSISEKLSKEMKINLNEALYIYLNYVMKSLDLDTKINEIIPFASTLLTPDQVMIGVPESLRKITFSILKPNSQRQNIIIREPIQTPAYILSP